MKELIPVIKTMGMKSAKDIKKVFDAAKICIEVNQTVEGKAELILEVEELIVICKERIKKLAWRAIEDN